MLAPPGASSGLPSSAVAGIVVFAVLGAVVLVVAVAGAYRLWVAVRLKRASPHPPSPPSPPSPKRSKSFDDLGAEQPARRPPILPSLRDAQGYRAQQDAARRGTSGTQAAV